MKTQILPKNTLIMPEQNRTVVMKESETTYIDLHTVLKNKYTLTKVVSENTGEASLFLCMADNQTFIAKVYHQNKKPKQEVLDTIKNIHSPNVIKAVDDGEVAGRYFEILPYYQHHDLLKHAPISKEILKNIIIPSVNNGLHSLHQNNLIHRDIKPNNLFFADDQSSVIIGDFGISSSLDQMTVRHTTLSRTLGYSAPETASGFVSIEADYYSFGVSLLQLATGIDPFAHMTEEQIIKITLMDKLIIPENLDKELALLVRGLTLKDRKERFGFEEVEKWCQGEKLEIIDRTIEINQPYYFQNQSYHSMSELALAMATNWNEGIKQIQRGLLSSYFKTFRQDIATEIMDYEELTNKDVALFKTIYLVDKNAPLCWYGEIFYEMSDLGKSIQNELPNINENYVSLLKTGMLHYFLKFKNANQALVMEVERLQQLENPYYQLYFLLNPESRFTFSNQSFSTVDELVEYLYEQRKEIETISAKILKDPFFFAWLENLGFSQHIAEWKKIKYE